MLSREALFLLNNLLFMGILIVCFWGVIFPLISEIFTGQKVTVGPPFYERATGPLWAGLLLLMGVAPLSAYGRTSSAQPRARAVEALRRLAASCRWPGGVRRCATRRPCSVTGSSAWWWRVTLPTSSGAGHRRAASCTGENLLLALGRLVGRNRRRYGGYVIHLGVVLMALGIIGIEMFQTETQGTLAQGEQLTLGRYVMTYDALTQCSTPPTAERRPRRGLRLSGRAQLGELYPRRDFYYASQQPMTIPGVRSTLEDDFYVILVDWQPIGTEGATFKIYHNPLVNFVWMGGLIFILGTLVAAWPEREAAAARARLPIRVDVARA